MSTGADVRDILELGGGDSENTPISKKDIINSDKKKSKKSAETLTFKRPEGMHREVYALLYSDKNIPVSHLLMERISLVEQLQVIGA